MSLLAEEVKLSGGMVNAVRLKNAAMAQRSKDKTYAAIIKLFNDKCEAVDETWEPVETIVEVINKVPGLGDENFVRPWVAHVHANMSAKFEFPQKFKDSVFNIMVTTSNSKLAYKLKQVKRRKSYSTIWGSSFRASYYN